MSVLLLEEISTGQGKVQGRGEGRETERQRGEGGVEGDFSLRGADKQQYKAFCTVACQGNPSALC